DGTNARFVSVAVRPVTLATILPAPLFGGAGMVTTGASPGAGFDPVVCAVTPLFVCNPFEVDGMSYDQATLALQEAAADPSRQRRLILLRQNGGTAAYGPGDYGFLDSDSLNPGTTAIVDALGSVHPTACFRQSGINVRPGFVASVRDGINVRFDLYGGACKIASRKPGQLPPVEGREHVAGGRGGANQIARPAPARGPARMPHNPAPP